MELSDPPDDNSATSDASSDRVRLPPRRRTKTLVLVLAWLSVLMVAGVVIVSWRLPLSRALEPRPDPAVVLVSADGHAFARRGAYKEAPVDIETLPPHVPAAFLAIEDRRFYRHHGLDFRGIARAALANVRARRVVQGGSTITQQLAKTTFLKPERTMGRKAQEVLITFWLEARLTKQEILERYLSSVYFGQGVYGLRAASRHFFNCSPEHLTVGQAAVLAGVVKAPSAGNPIAHPRKAAKRAEVVLQAMVETGALTAAQAKAAQGARVRPGRRVLPVGGYFADWVEPQVRSAFDAGYGEVEVRTTLDWRLQRRAERTVRRLLEREGKDRRAGQAALIAMRSDGAVLAMVGGRDYRKSQFNRVVQARRQPGSAFKLFVYLAALRDGAEPDMLVSQAPITVDGWTPRNFDRSVGGELTLREAFARSSNIAAVRVAETAGRQAVVKAARDLGVRSALPDDPTLSLGTAEMPIVELAAAYAGVASGRSPVIARGLPPSPSITPQGRPLRAHERDAMLDLLHAAVAEGTGARARLPQAVFGKTGTSQDYRDAVFVGFTGDVVTAVWVGNDDRSPMRGVTGGDLPARIWFDFMLGAIQAGELPRGPSETAPARRRGPDLESVIRRLIEMLGAD